MYSYQPPAPMRPNQPYQDQWETAGMDQALPWRPHTAPSLGYEEDPGPNLCIEFQYRPVDNTWTRDQPSSDHQYTWDSLMGSTVTSQGFNPQPMAANFWSHSQVPGYHVDMLREIPNRPVAHNPVFQSPMTHEDVSAGHRTIGYIWPPQRNVQRERAVLHDHSGQGNISSFSDQGGNFSTPPDVYGPQQLLLPTPLPGIKTHGSPKTTGLLYEEKMRSYLQEEEPWRPSGVDHENYEAIQDRRDRSYDYSHGQWISLGFG